ncbi:MAG: methyltransferase [Myxococcales bacterium]|nr:methyltransferase [Myxococcales bacterium]MCB9521700.1 methyltransferase [Myxococcales bacterium]MCB9531916.1 methyltransferase [Myxococcales bacterium]MCB9533884.1 methyltransferase [Myxococcales bacterium]
MTDAAPPRPAAATVSTTTPWGQPFVEPKRGYRFGPDSALLYELLRDPTLAPTAPRRVLDLGAGCGVLGLAAVAAAADRGVAARATLVERDPDLAALARENLGRSGRDGEVVEADLRSTPVGVADLVVANPPFFVPGEGVESRVQHARAATHAYFGDVADFVAAAAAALSPDGALMLLYPADRAAAALATLAAASLAVDALLVVHARHTGAPYRVWARCMRPESSCGVRGLVRTMSAVTAR